MPQIESFELSPSFNTYTTDPISTLKPTSTINIFVGSNNSGKSRFLRILSIQKEYKVLLKGVNLSSINQKIQHIFDLLKMHLSKAGLEKANNDVSNSYINNLRSLPDYLSLNLDSYEELRSVFSRWKNFQEIKDWRDQIHKPSSSSHREEFRKAIINESDKAYSILEQIPIHSEITIPKRVYIPVLRGLRPIDAERSDLYAEQTKKDYFSTDISSPPEVFTGLSLYDDIMAMLLGDNKQRKKIAEYQEFITNSPYAEG